MKKSKTSSVWIIMTHCLFARYFPSKQGNFMTTGSYEGLTDLAPGFGHKRCDCAELDLNSSYLVKHQLTKINIQLILLIKLNSNSHTPTPQPAHHGI